MEEGGGRFPGILDPGAEEFRPKGVLDSQNTLFQPQFYYPCQSYPTAGGYEYHAPPRQVKPVSASATRTLLLSLVPQHLMEATVKRELEVFGEIRMVEMQRLAKEGMVTVHFYDVRHARTALMEIQEQHMRQQSRLGHHYSDAMMRNWTDCAPPMPVPGSRGLIAGYAVWAQFTFPTTAIAFGDGMNQGTLVVFNLDRSVSSSKLKEVFQVFGAVKELRETPLKREHRFVEFYDIRDAARALSEMNGKELCGKRIVVEFSRPGGRRFGNPTDSVPCNTNTAASSSSNSYYRKNTTANYLPRPPPPLPLPPRLFGQQRLRQNACSSRKCHNLTNKGKGQDAASTPSPPSSWSAGNGNEGDRAEENSKRNSRKQQRFQSKPFCRRFPSSKHKKKQSDGNFLFKEDAMDESICSDSRTTVMIKNIPNKYSQKLLLYMLDNHCIHCNEQIAEGDEDEPLSSYDFVYLPIDFINKCNVGYGFVNLTSPKAAWRLYKSFHFQPWEVFNSRKICQVTYARLQGLDALKEHFKNSKFACDIDEYMPVVFEPARDGKQLTEPVAIGGQASGSAKKAALAGSKSSEEETHDPTDGEDGCTSNQMDGGDDGEEDDGDEDDGDGRSTEAPVDLGHSNFPSSSSAPIAAC